MGRSRRTFIGIVALTLISTLVIWGRFTLPAQAEEQPTRQTTIVTTVQQYEWWLIRWSDNQITCVVKVDHEGVPTGSEILQACGKAIYDEWRTTAPCEKSEKGPAAASTCPGMYLFLAGSQTGEKTIVVELPPPSVILTLSNCSPIPPKNLCTDIPSLLLTGEEPLPNEQIIAIHAIVNGIAVDCAGNICEIPLKPTALDGIKVEFWAESSFGDSSVHFIALVRVLESGVSPVPGGSGWYVDVLSSQWRGGPVESCAQIWQAFPPVGGSPFWLSSPSGEELLASDEPYHYLAGRLISNGLVDAADCPGGGLLDNGYANACGLEKSRSMVELWQNQFDPRILSVAQETGLPAQLMKNLFAQESQFWPGVFRVAREFGLGQMTDMGADTILLWNNSFFDQFCPLVLDESACGRGYLRLKDGERAILRGALAVRMNADCQDCPSGIDLSDADYSIMLFAQSLLANCDQVAQTIYNATKSKPGEVSSYEDLWRFTLANYHVGPGCLAFGIYATWNAREPLDWEHMTTHLTEPCKGIISYVELISK